MEYLFIIFFPFIAFWCTGIFLFRTERLVGNFYWPLREYYPRSYVKQSPLISSLRKKFKMDSTGTIHWFICLMHYFQLVMLTLPPISLLLFLILTKEWAMRICIMIPLMSFMVTVGGMGYIFTLSQCIKCSKIRKRNPKYSKLKFWDEDIHI